MAHLLKGTQNTVEQRQNWLDQAQKALAVVADFPKEIQELEGRADISSDLKLNIFLYGGEKTVEVLKRHGWNGFKRTFSSFQGNYYYEASGQIGTLPICWLVLGASAPDNCKVEPYIETVTYYREVCDGQVEEEQANETKQ